MARAVLILDEPTSALGVHQASIVLRYVAQARENGLGVIFITHNIHHAYPVGDKFTLLNRGRSVGTFRKNEITEMEVLDIMAGKRELKALEAAVNEVRLSASCLTCSILPADLGATSCSPRSFFCR